MTAEPLDSLPLWSLPLLAAGLLLLAIEAGYHFGRWRHGRSPDEREQPVGAMVASILGLLALVLGFTFSLAASRFDERRHVVLSEANAIGTAYLRAKLLPEPERSEVARLLYEYTDVRIRGVQENRPLEAVARSEALHELLWVQAASAAEKTSQPITTGLFIQALNNMIDLHAERVMVGLRSRIPLVVWSGLFLLASLSMMAVGYVSGLSATRRSPAMLGLVVAFTVVLFLIADLDRTQEGLLRVGQQVMLDVQRTMEPPSINSPPRQEDR